MNPLTHAHLAEHKRCPTRIVSHPLSHAVHPNPSLPSSSPSSIASVAAMSSSLLPLLLLLLLPLAGAFITTIQPRTEFCVTLVGFDSTPQRLAGNFDVLHDSSGPVTATLTQLTDAGKTSLIYQSIPGDGEGSFIVAPPIPDTLSTFQLCVQNGVTTTGVWPDENGRVPDKADKIPRKVGMSLRSLVYDTSSSEGAAGEKLANARLAATELFEAYDTLADHQSYMRTREKDHRDLVEMINSRVVNWRIVEAGVLVLVCFWQIWFLRRFFETKRMV